MTQFGKNLFKPALVIRGTRVVSLNHDSNFKISYVELEIKVPDFKEDAFYYLTISDRVATYLVREGFLPEGEVKFKIRPVK